MFGVEGSVLGRLLLFKIDFSKNSEYLMYGGGWIGKRAYRPLPL